MSSMRAFALLPLVGFTSFAADALPPGRDIVVALTADEEDGGPYNGVDWLIKNKRELIDAELCLCHGVTNP
jgi:acetylornithine deacetylase/succinyl-diaminopimelate desuccinylase-like protein